MVKAKKQTEFEQQVGELTQDLQRTRADFENFRKRVEEEKVRAKESGATNMIMKMLPIVDDIERAVGHIPKELEKDNWAKGVVSLVSKLNKTLSDIGVKQIEAKPGLEFNPELHEAIQVDEEATGDKEVIDEVLQAGYMLNNSPIRAAIVKVTRK